MAKFGDKLRAWSKVVWEEEDEKVKKILEEEWQKATNKLVSGTPKGTIRFTLLDRYPLIIKLKGRLLGMHKDICFIQSILKKKLNSDNFVAFDNFTNFPPYTSEAIRELGRTLLEPDERKVLLFYANNIKPNFECAKEVIEYWFETYVLKEFEEGFKKEKNSAFSEAGYSHYISYWPFKHVFDHFNFEMDEEKYKQIFSELCDKHGLKLKDADIFGIRIAL